MAEVGLAGAGRDDQAVVGNRERVAVGAHRRHGPGLQVEARHLGQLDPTLRWRRSTLRIGGATSPSERMPGRHLVEQRLEQVVVRPVDQGHLDRGAPQEARREEPAEAAADDDDPVRAWCAVGGGWVGGVLSMLWRSIVRDREA